MQLSDKTYLDERIRFFAKREDCNSDKRNTLKMQPLTERNLQ